MLSLKSVKKQFVTKKYCLKPVWEKEITRMFINKWVRTEARRIGQANGIGRQMGSMHFEKWDSYFCFPFMATITGLSPSSSDVFSQRWPRVIGHGINKMKRTFNFKGHYNTGSSYHF